MNGERLAIGGPGHVGHPGLQGPAPTPFDPAGLPPHLTGTPVYERPDGSFSGGGVELAESIKLKCPKCDTVQKAANDECTSCGHDLSRARKAKFAKLDAGQEHAAVIYNTQGLNLSTDQDGLVWKVACKTGTLALSPGPGQTDAERPLELTPDLFEDMVLSAKEQAFPYITVPETHANGALENTGYVRDWAVLTRDELLADSRLPERHRGIIEADPSDTRYLLAGIDFVIPEVRQKALLGAIPDTSIGVKFNYRNKRTGKLYRAAWEHLALTPMPWVDGLVPFGLSQQGGVYDQSAEPRYDGVYTPMDLGISFDPKKHPRDFRGRFREVLGGLKPGDSVNLPDGTSVERGKSGFKVKLKGESKGIEHPEIRDIDTASETALRKSSSAGPAGELPTRLDYDDLAEQARRAELENKMRNDLRNAEQANKAKVARQNAENAARQALQQKSRNLSQDDPVRTSKDLAAGRERGTLHRTLHADQNREDSSQMPKTVEELLASQQAELEAAQQRIRDMESQLSLAQGTISSQGEQLHAESVNRRVRQLQAAGYSPKLCQVVKEVLLADKSRIDGTEGLALSVQTAGEDGTPSERKLASATDVVEYLLSAVPVAGAEDAARMAAISGGLGSLHASAHEDRNSEEARLKAVEELERKRHPERFGPDGKRL